MEQKKTYKLKEFIKLRNVRSILSSFSNKDEKDFKFFLEVLKNSKKLQKEMDQNFTLYICRKLKDIKIYTQVMIMRKFCLC